jgi:ribosome-associated protein
MADRKKRKQPAKKAGARPKVKARTGPKPGGKKAPAKRARKAPSSRQATATRKRPPLKSRRPTLRPRRPGKGKAKAPRLLPTLKENPEALALSRTIARVALDKKATDVVIIDTRLRGSAVGYDYVVLASGDSDRQLEAIADAVDEVLRPRGTRPTSVEASGDWVLVNYADVVAHFFTPEKRAIYDLEGLWSDVPRVASAPV